MPVIVHADHAELLHATCKVRARGRSTPRDEDRRPSFISSRPATNRFVGESAATLPTVYSTLHSHMLTDNLAPPTVPRASISLMHALRFYFRRRQRTSNGFVIVRRGEKGFASVIDCRRSRWLSLNWKHDSLPVKPHVALAAPTRPAVFNRPSTHAPRPCRDIHHCVDPVSYVSNSLREAFSF
jgi:hypothetical protein